MPLDYLLNFSTTATTFSTTTSRATTRDEESTTDLEFHNHNDSDCLKRSECENETFQLGGKSIGEDEVESKEAKDAELQIK